MKRLWLCLLVCSGCAGIDEGGTLQKVGRVEGQLVGPAGDAWLFLYGTGEGFPGLPAFPKLVSAASAARRAQGDNAFVFAQVGPNPYRLWAFVDVNGNF